jgi:hypothetical protein
MGWLVPEFTKAVTLKLTAEDAKREALGRALSLGGASVGILGGIMILRSNPAARALLSGGATTTTLTAKEANQDALGKTLALVGTAVGAAGSVLVMSSSPKMRDKFATQFDALPAGLKQNKRLLALLAIGLLGAGTVYLIRSQNSTLAERYT